MSPDTREKIDALIALHTPKPKPTPKPPLSVPFRKVRHYLMVHTRIPRDEITEEVIVHFVAAMTDKWITRNVHGIGKLTVLMLRAEVQQWQEQHAKHEQP